MVVAQDPAAPAPRHRHQEANPGPVYRMTDAMPAERCHHRLSVFGSGFRGLCLVLQNAAAAAVGGEEKEINILAIPRSPSSLSFQDPSSIW